MSESEWLPHLQLARVTRAKGKEMMHVGRGIHGHVYLLPEEALLLVDRGVMLIRHDGGWMTTQGAFRLLLPLIPQPHMCNYLVHF